MKADGDSVSCHIMGTSLFTFPCMTSLVPLYFSRRDEIFKITFDRMDLTIYYYFFIENEHFEMCHSHKVH